MSEPSLENRLASAGMFVRARLDERLTLETIAASAGFSPFHFHRIFRVAFGENLNAFVARHRMQRAAHELRHTDRSIIDIGLRCGYESASAFGRAFARAFEQSPSAYRAEPGPLPMPPAAAPTVRVGLPEPRVMDYREREAFGIRFVGPYDALGPTMERLYEIAVKRRFVPGAEIVGLSFDSPDLEEHDALRFDACATAHPNADVPGALGDGLRPIAIPGGRYAVFRHRGSYHRITHAYDVIVATYVLTERFVLRDAPFINTYLTDPATSADTDMESDLAIPIR